MFRLRDRFMSFMYGRYGADQLYYALFVVYVLLLVLNIFTPYVIIDILMWSVLAWMFFRVFSRNIYSRQKENAVFLKVWNPVKSEFSLLLRRIREIKTHRFRKCHNCKTTLRLPRRTGKHMVKCPRCQNRFKVKVFF
jgi:hypothetical protein